MPFPHLLKRTRSSKVETGDELVYEFKIFANYNQALYKVYTDKDSLPITTYKEMATQ